MTARIIIFLIVICGLIYFIPSLLSNSDKEKYNTMKVLERRCVTKEYIRTLSLEERIKLKEQCQTIGIDMVEVTPND